MPILTTLLLFPITFSLLVFNLLSLIGIMEPFLSTFVIPFLYNNYSKFQQVAFGVRFENHHGLLPIHGITTLTMKVIDLIILNNNLNYNLQACLA